LKKKKSSSKAPVRTLADVIADLQGLADIVVPLNNAVVDLHNTFLRMEEHLQEIDLKLIFTMNTITISRKRHGGILVAGEPEKITKKLMEWYRDGGRDALKMQLEKAAHDLKAIEDQVGGQTQDNPDENPDEGKGAPPGGSGTTH
jgi:hypothetical protein